MLNSFVIQKINAKITVYVVFEHQTLKVIPKVVIWGGKVHTIVKVGLHHVFRRGRTAFHVFSVASETLFFRLVLDTDKLYWTLKEIADAESN